VLEAGGGDIRLEVAGASRWMRKALHDLCQPLTALDCLLYVGVGSNGGGTAGGADSKALEQALEGAARECGRMMEMVRAMQSRMAAEEHEILIHKTAGH